MCDMQTFQNVNADVWGRLRAKAQEKGVTVDSNSGTKSKLGVKVFWNYDPGTEVLQIQVLSAFVFGCKRATGMVDATVQSCMTG